MAKDNLIKIGGELKSVAADGVVAGAEAIYDYSESKSQATINQELKQAIEDIDVTDQISGKADKSEMSVVAGTGANADKTTITLKNGTSATVLTQHQDVSEFLKEGEVFGEGDDSTASFNSYSDTVWNKQQTLSESQKQQIRDNIGVGAADNEDIQSVNGTLKFADRAYTATTSSVQGNMGYKILRKGSTFASQVTSANTIYEIRYDYDLNGQIVTLPAGCVLKFEGGSVKNGTIVGNDTLIQGGTDLSGVTLSGTFNNEFFDLYDVGCKPNDESAAAANSTRILALISSLENIKVTLVVPEGTWYYNTPLVLSGDFKLQCNGTLVYKSDANNVVNTALTIGNTTKQTQKNHTIRLSQITSYQFTSTIIDNVGLRLINICMAEVTIAQATNFVYCIIIEANGQGCAYNTFNLGKFGWGHHYCGLKIQPIGSSGWVNENIFVGGALHVESINVNKNNNVGLWIEGSSAHKANNNVFLKPCLEGATVGVKFVNALQNCIYDMRDELVSTIQQSTDSKANFISRYSGLVNFQAVVSDKFTKFNIVRQHVYSARTSHTRYKIGSTSYASAIQLDVATYSYATIGQNIKLYGTNTYVGKIVDTSNAKCFSVGLKNAGRCVLICYDANDNLITPSSRDDVLAANNIRFAISGDGHTLISQADETYIDFEFTDTVKKAFIGCNAAYSKYIEVYAYTQNKYGEFGISTGLNTCNDLNTAETINAEVGDAMLDSYGVPAMWNGEKWVDYFGDKAGLVRNGITLQRPTLSAAEFGFTYFDKDLNSNITGGKKSLLTQKSVAYKNAANNADKYFYAIPESGNYFVKVANNSIRVLLATTNDFSTAETQEIGIATKLLPLSFTIDSIATYPYILFANNYGSGETLYFYSLDMSKWFECDGAIAGVVRNGTTNQRPSSDDIYVGFQYFDTTLGKPIYYNGTDWVDATGATV